MGRGNPPPVASRRASLGAHSEQTSVHKLSLGQREPSPDNRPMEPIPIAIKIVLVAAAVPTAGILAAIAWLTYDCRRR